VPFRASGLFNNINNKFLPLKYIPQLEIEFELAGIDDFLLCLNPSSSATPAHRIAASDITVSDGRLLYDTILLDSGIEDKFYKHLEAGGTLDLPFSTWRNTRQVITNGSFAVQTAANVKSAKSVFFSVIKKNEQLIDGAADEDRDFNITSALATTGLAAVMQPTAGAAGMFYRNGLQNLELQLGSNIYPDSPVSSTAEFFHYLEVAWNKQNSYVDPIGITWQEYNNDKSGPYTPGEGNQFGTSDLALTDLGPYPVVPALTATPLLDHYAAVRNYGSRFICGFNLERLLDSFYSGISLENEVISVKADCKQNVGATYCSCSGLNYAPL
jgi:hypothetical protein